MKKSKKFRQSLAPHLSLLLTLLLAGSANWGCADLMKAHRENTGEKAEAPQSEPSPKPVAARPEWAAVQEAQNARIQDLETKLGALNEKIDAQRSVLDNWISSQQSQVIRARPPVQDGVGRSVQTPAASSDPMAGFSSDEPIQRYRKAMLLFQSKNYPDAILGFSAFVDRFPDHALAGSAQYYLAECYFAQHQPKLAEREYQRVLTTYDRSPHISDTLERVAECEDDLGQSQAAAKHREMLRSLFPSSPAAARMANLTRQAPQAPQVSNEMSREARPEVSHEMTAGSPATAESSQTPATPIAPAPSAQMNQDGLDSPPPTASSPETSPTTK